MQETQNATIERLQGNVPVLDTIVKKIENTPTEKKEIVDQVVIRYERKRGIAEKLKGRNFSLSALFGFGPSYEYYKVDTHQSAKVNFSHQYKVSYPIYGDMEVTFEYFLNALEGGEPAIVEQLMRRNTPSELLAGKLDEWARAVIKENLPVLFTNFDEFSRRFNQALYSLAVHTGLGITTKTSYKKSAIPLGENLPVVAKGIRVQPKNFNDFILLGFDLVLVPDKNNGSSTLASLSFAARESFKELLTKWLQEYIRDTTTYNDIASQLHFKVRTGLIEYLNRQMRNNNKGWMVAELAMDTADTPPVNFKFERLQVDVGLRNAKVPLTNTVILNLENAERFRNSRVSNLESWIKEKLQQSAENILSRVSYAELVSRIDQLGSIIKSDLDKHAEKIGYKVEYLLTSDLVDNSRLSFEFQFTEEEQNFQTSLGEHVKLNIVTSGRIRSLDHHTWRNYLTPDTNFADEMKKDVLWVVRQQLLKMNADDFYTRFNEIVEKTLADAIRDLLVSQFNVDPAVDISASMQLSVIRQLIIDLQRGIQYVDIKCFENAVMFRVSFSVASVDPDKWSLFAGRNYTNAEEVKRVVGERIRIFVENGVKVHIRDIMTIVDPRSFIVISRFAQESDTMIRDKMGLIIEIVDVEQIIDKEEHDTSKAYVDAIRGLEQQIIKKIASGDDDWDVQTLISKKDKLKKLLEQHTSSMHTDQPRISAWLDNGRMGSLPGKAGDVKPE